MTYNYKYLSTTVVKEYLSEHTTAEDVRGDIRYYQEEGEYYRKNIDQLQETLAEAIDEVEDAMRIQRNAFDDLEHAIFDDDSKTINVLHNDYGGEDVLSAYEWYLDIKKKIRANEEMVEDTDNAIDDLWHILEILEEREGL